MRSVRGRLAGIDVGHDADVAIALDCVGACHDPLVLGAAPDPGLPARETYQR